MNRFRTILLNLILIAVGTLIGAAAFELAVRFFEPQALVRYRFSEATFYEPVPDARFHHERSEFRTLVEFNEHGMRDLPRNVEKPHGVRRVALMGDSFVEAMQVELAESYTQQLEKQFQEEHSAGVEVLNFGVSGFGPVSSLKRYLGAARPFDPDLVVYLFVANDPWDLVSGDRRLYRVENDALLLQDVTLSGTERIARSVVDFLKQHSHGYHFLKIRLMSLTQKGEREEAEARGEEAGTKELIPPQGAWDTMAIVLREFRNEVESTGARFVVIQATTRGPIMDQVLREICERLGVPFLNVNPEIRTRRDETFFVHDGHWRARGHAMAAEQSAEFLRPFLRFDRLGR